MSNDKTTDDLENWHLSLEDETAMKQWLTQDNIPTVHPTDIQQTINTVKLQWQLTKKRTKKQTRMDLLRITKTELLFFTPFYWVITLTSFFIALLLAYFYTHNWYSISFFVAPVILIVSLSNLMKHRTAAIHELEMSFPYNSQQIFFAKLFIVNCYNLLLNSLLSLFIYLVIPSLHLPTLLLAWWIPFVIVSFISFVLTILFRYTVTTSTLIILWIVFFVMEQSQFHIMDHLMTPSLSIWMIAIITPLISYITQTKFIFSYWKGWEINGTRT